MALVLLLMLQGRTSGGHGLLEAVPRIYQVTPDIPDRRRATQQKEVRPTGRQPQRESARRPVAEPSPSVGRRRRPRIETASLNGAAPVPVTGQCLAIAGAP